MAGNFKKYIYNILNQVFSKNVYLGEEESNKNDEKETESQEAKKLPYPKSVAFIVSISSFYF